MLQDQSMTGWDRGLIVGVKNKICLGACSFAIIEVYWVRYRPFSYDEGWLELTDVVFMCVTFLSMSITFYFGYKILKTNWKTNIKFMMLLLIIVVPPIIGLAVVFFLINFLGLNVHN